MCVVLCVRLCDGVPHMCVIVLVWCSVLRRCVWCVCLSLFCVSVCCVVCWFICCVIVCVVCGLFVFVNVM